MCLVIREMTVMKVMSVAGSRVYSNKNAQPLRNLARPGFGMLSLDMPQEEWEKLVKLVAEEYGDISLDEFVSGLNENKKYFSDVDSIIAALNPPGNDGVTWKEFWWGFIPFHHKPGEPRTDWY
jgi:hypothetical protein